MNNSNKMLAAVFVYLAPVILNAIVGGVSLAEWVSIGVAGVTALGVYVVKNVPQFPILKFVVALLGAGLQVLTSAVSDGVVTNQEWVAVALGVVGAVAVYVFPNGLPDTTTKYGEGADHPLTG